jgi:hypothetical protein
METIDQILQDPPVANNFRNLPGMMLGFPRGKAFNAGVIKEWRWVDRCVGRRMQR